VDSSLYSHLSITLIVQSPPQRLDLVGLTSVCYPFSPSSSIAIFRLGIPSLTLYYSLSLSLSLSLSFPFLISAKLTASLTKFGSWVWATSESGEVYAGIWIWLTCLHGWMT